MMRNENTPGVVNFGVPSSSSTSERDVGGRGRGLLPSAGLSTTASPGRQDHPATDAALSIASATLAGPTMPPATRSP